MYSVYVHRLSTWFRHFPKKLTTPPGGVIYKFHGLVVATVHLCTKSEMPLPGFVLPEI